MNKKSKDQQKGEKTYQIRPQFKDKFRPGEAKERMEKIVHEHLKGKNDKGLEKQPTPAELNQLTKEIAD